MSSESNPKHLRRLVRMASMGAYIGVASLPRVARAETQEPIFVRAEGSIPCATTETFFARVRQRAPVARQAEPREQARTFTISVEGSAPEMRGSLLILRLDGSTTTRHVTGESCDEVVDALALITAIDIDPHAMESPPSEPPLETSFVPSPEPAGPPHPRGALLPSTRWQMFLGAEVAVTGGIAPVPLFGVPIYLELVRASADLLSPSIGFGFERTFVRMAKGTSGDADFDMFRGFVLGCPVAWSSDRLRVAPCLRFDVGAVRGIGLAGKEIFRPATKIVPWLAVDLSGRATYRLIGTLHVDLQLDLGTPLVPTYQFQADPGIPLGGVQRWNWRAALGIEVRFL